MLRQVNYKQEYWKLVALCQLKLTLLNNDGLCMHKSNATYQIKNGYNTVK